MCSLEPLKGISLKKFYLVKKMYNYEKYLLKTLKIEEPYVGTSVENQIWLSDRVARYTLAASNRKWHVGLGMPR